MPPKTKYTKELIIENAFELVRSEGIDALTARRLGDKLGCSPQPIFSCFENMEEVKREIKSKATELYVNFLDEEMKKEMPFKRAGMAYIRFAKEEPKLFHLLFLQKSEGEPIRNYLQKNDPNYKNILSALMKSHNMSESEADELYSHISVYTYGFAMLFYQGAEIFTLEEVEQKLTEMFHILKRKEQK
jgi:AcrR family transcriptional regulator